MSKWKLPVLLSFAYYKDTFDLKEMSKDFHIIIDSGAFSIHNSKMQLDINDYINFLKTKVPAGVKYFNFDVIGDVKASFRNFMYMRRKGLDPIPVITGDASLEDIAKYDNLSDYISIGGLNIHTSATGKTSRVKMLMDGVCKNRPCHWLGFCNIDFIKYYKPTSCDATTWLVARRFGEICVLTESGIIRMSRRQILNAKLSVRNAIADAGFDIGDLYTKDNWSGGTSLSALISCVMSIKYVRLIQKKVGTNMHLVGSSQGDFDMLLKAKKYLEDRGELA